MDNPQVDKWKAKMQMLEAQLKEASADARIEIQNQINDLKEKLNENT